MLSRAEIDELLLMRLDETQARERLARLTTPALLSLSEPGAQIRLIRDALAQTAVDVPPLPVAAMDCCGTGGSGRAHFNTSTTVAFVLASGGVPVVKFGNRAVTSASGSFDLLNKLAIAPLPPARVADALAECGIAFLYAPDVYPALKAFHQMRRSLGFPTVFNLLGPLLNPVSPPYRLMGVSDPMAQHLLAPLLAEEPTLRRAWLVNGLPDAGSDGSDAADAMAMGVDEIILNGLTTVFDITPGQVDIRLLNRFHAEQGAPPSGYGPAVNARLFAGIVRGEDVESDAYHMVRLNAGAGFVAYGLAPDLEAGVAQAAELLANGRTRQTVERVQAFLSGLSA